MSLEETENLEELEKMKYPSGEVTLIGTGRLGFRTALNLLEVHRGGPKTITAIDGQRISDDDIVFKKFGAVPGEYKVDFIEKFAGENSSKIVRGVAQNISCDNLDLVKGDVVCIGIAGGDTLPITAAIIKRAHEIGTTTIGTMGVFGLGDEKIMVTDVGEGDPENPVVGYLMDHGITENHLLVGTGKLIRDWEPITPAIMDRIAGVITTEIVMALRERRRQDD